MSNHPTPPRMLGQELLNEIRAEEGKPPATRWPTLTPIPLTDEQRLQAQRTERRRELLAAPFFYLAALLGLCFTAICFSLAWKAVLWVLRHLHLVITH